ncbi:helix-turn-helix transcriptional regulator [Pseudomonas duriflava]|nr:response regulator transcription factor [Pseudomonas duriflava]
MATGRPPFTVKLLTKNQLLGQLFQHFLNQQAEFELCVDDFNGLDRSVASLWLLDVGSVSLEQCVDSLDTLIHQAPVALVNTTDEQAQQLMEKHPEIKGIFYTHTSRELLLTGIQAMLMGRDWLPRDVMERLIARFRRLQALEEAVIDLTVREREILSLVGKGYSNAEIAHHLCLSTHTVKSHIHNLLRKIGASNRAEAALKFYEKTKGI